MSGQHCLQLRCSFPVFLSPAGAERLKYFSCIGAVGRVLPGTGECISSHTKKGSFSETIYMLLPERSPPKL